MISAVRNEVKQLLQSADSGHRIDHIDRVLGLSIEFVKTCSINLDEEIVKLIAILHDVDDYKLFGKDYAIYHTNANTILSNVGASDNIKSRVLKSICEIGFGTRLKGICPSSIETMIVSDADMCDAMGINGILRAIQYGESINRPFFKEGCFPRKDITHTLYIYYPPETTMNLIFEKLLNLMPMIITAPAYEEATKRYQSMIQYLRSYFRENRLIEWDDYLTKYLTNLKR